MSDQGVSVADTTSPVASGRGAGRRLLVALAGVLLLAACGPGAPSQERAEADDLPVGVAVSVPPLGWFVQAVGGGLVDVTVLVPPGASPAVYEPTMSQLRSLDRAELWITVGHPRFPFERAWEDRLTGGRPDLRVVGAGAGCRHDSADPHLWTSPACARRLVERIARALSEVRPSAADSVRAGRRRVLASVEAVDRDLRRWLEPHRGRTFLVVHPALGYLARDYGLDQMAIQRGGTEPSAAELDRLVRTARERGIRHVFVQPQFSQEAAAVVAGALPEGEVVVVDPLSGDWPSAQREIGRALEAALSSAAGRVSP